MNPPDSPAPETVLPSAVTLPQEWRRSTGWAVKAVQVRLRFVIVVTVAVAVVGWWDAARNRRDRLIGSFGRGDAWRAAVSSDTEFFCPMDPGVVSDGPGKCGVCNMPLVARRKGEADPLPPGVVSRVQLSPDRLRLAGVRTARVGYQPLARTLVLVGTVAGEADGSTRIVTSDERGHAVSLIAAGQAVEVLDDGPSGRVTRAGTVAPRGPAEDQLSFHVDDRDHALRPGTTVTIRVHCPVAGLEPFRSLPADPPPLRAGEARSVLVCPEHGDIVCESPGRCPVDGRYALEERVLLSNQRLGWWCPNHPRITADRPGQECHACGGLRLLPRVVSYRPAGEVLAVPETAVIGTSARTLVYVQRAPDAFEGVEVTLGPRCGDFYPVIRGLEPGLRVVTSGAFLVDAETRINPALASAYFGAAGGARVEEPREGAASDRPVARP